MQGNDGMIPAVHGPAYTSCQSPASSMEGLSPAESCKRAIPVYKAATQQRLQPTRRLRDHAALMLATQHSSTTIPSAAATGALCSPGPQPASNTGAQPMELMSPAGHGSRSPMQHRAAAAPAAPETHQPGQGIMRASVGLGHGYPLCIAGVQSMLFHAPSPAAKHGLQSSGKDKCGNETDLSQKQPLLRRSQRKSVSTRMF